MNKKTNSYLKTHGLLLIVLALVLLTAGTLILTSAWFTDSVSKDSSAVIQFGTVEISADGGNDNEEAVVNVANVNASNSVLMPGSSVSTSVRVKNTGNVDCYYLVSFVCSNNILASTYNNDYFYNLTSSAVTKSTLDNKLCGALSPNNTQTLNMNLTISTDVTKDDLSSTDAEIKCVVYAVQKAHITEPEAYYILQTLKTTQFPESKTIMLFNEDMSWSGNTTSVTSGVKLVYTDDSKSQFYLDASSLDPNTTNATGDDLYFFSSEAYDTSIYTNKYATTENSYLAKLSTAYNYDLTYDLSNKYIYDTPSHSLNLYPVFLTANAGHEDKNKDTYDEGTTDYVIYAKDKTETEEKEFWLHSFIKAVVLPNTITTVSPYTFSDTSLKYLTLPTSNLTTLLNSAFTHTEIEYLNLPANITKLSSDSEVDWSDYYGSNGAFIACKSLKSVKINGDLENMCDAFVGCRSLESVVINGNVGNMSSGFSGCSSLKTVEFGENCKIIKETSCAFQRTTSLESVTFKGLQELYGTGPMFRYSSLTTLDLGDSLKKIEGYCTLGYNTSLLSVDLGENIEDINADGLFIDSSNLSIINFGSSLKTLRGQQLIDGTSVTSIDLPCTLELLGNVVFWYGLEEDDSKKISGSIGIPGKCVIEGDSNGPFIGDLEITDFYLMDENGNKIKESTLYVERDGVIYKKLGNGQYRLECFPGAYTGEFTIYKDVVALRRFEVDNGVNITKFIVEEENPSFKTDSYGVVYNKEGTQLRIFPQSCGLNSYSVPEGVTEIYLFYSDNPLALTVPSTLTSLPGCAFGSSNIVSINSTEEGVADFSNTQIEFVGYKCFQNNRTLKHIILPSTCSTIQSGAFIHSSINKITTYYDGKLTLTNQGSLAYVNSGDMLAYTGYNADTGEYEGIAELHILTTLLQSIYKADEEWSAYIFASGSRPKLYIYNDVVAKN